MADRDRSAPKAAETTGDKTVGAVVKETGLQTMTEGFLKSVLVPLLIEVGAELSVHQGGRILRSLGAMFSKVSSGQASKEDLDKVKTAYDKLKAGSGAEALDIIQGQFKATQLADEEILGERGLRAVRGGLITVREMTNFLAYLAAKPKAVRERFRKAFELQQDKDLQTANFAQLAKMSAAERDAYISGTGLGDQGIWETMGERAQQDIPRLEANIREKQERLRNSRKKEGFWKKLGF